MLSLHRYEEDSLPHDSSVHWIANILNVLLKTPEKPQRTQSQLTAKVLKCFMYLNKDVTSFVFFHYVWDSGESAEELWHMRDWIAEGKLWIRSA